MVFLSSFYSEKAFGFQAFDFYLITDIRLDLGRYKRKAPGVTPILS
jgi:hypothetical protein